MTTVQRGCRSKNGISSLRRSLRFSCTMPLASMPWSWNTDLIVCSQSTKRVALALRPDGDGVTYLDGFAGDDHAVDQQLQQRSLALKVRLLQALPHALAERRGMARETSGFGPAVGVVREVAFLAIQREQPTLGLPPAALVLVQLHHAGKVGLREPFDLLVQPRPGAAQVGTSCLHLLRQPVPPARTLISGAASTSHRSRQTSSSSGWPGMWRVGQRSPSGWEGGCVLVRQT